MKKWNKELVVIYIIIAGKIIFYWGNNVFNQLNK